VVQTILYMRLCGLGEFLRYSLNHLIIIIIRDVFNNRILKTGINFQTYCQWRRAIEALEARAPPDGVATLVNSLQNRV